MTEFVIECWYDIDDGWIAGEYREEIVRCRDCKHMHMRYWFGTNVPECWLHADRESGALGKEPTEPDGFCSWGERRANE